MVVLLTTDYGFLEALHTALEVPHRGELHYQPHGLKGQSDEAEDVGVSEGQHHPPLPTGLLVHVQ